MPKFTEGRVAIGALIAFAFWIFVGLPLIYLPSNQDEQRVTPAKSQSQITAPATIGAAQEIDAKPHAANAQEKQRSVSQILLGWLAAFFEIKLTDFVIAIFTVVLAIKTAGLFKETAGLRSAANQQAADMKASIAAAQTSAEAAQKAADVAESALIMADRPYLAPREPITKFWRWGQSGMPVSNPAEYDFIIEYGVRNLGRSVAFLKEITVGVLVAKQLPETPDYSDRRIVPGHMPIAANSAPFDLTPYGAKQRLSAETFQKIQSGELKLFFFGYMKYSDLLGYLRVGGFCFRFTQLGEATAQRQSQCTISGGPKYNYERSEKIPPEGIAALPVQGSEFSAEEIEKFRREAGIA